MRFWFGRRSDESRAERRTRHREQVKAQTRRQPGQGRASSLDPVTGRNPDDDVITRYGDPSA